MRLFRKDIAQIALTKLMAERLPLIVRLLLLSSLLLSSKLKPSTITTRRIGSCGRNSIASLARGKTKTKACLLPVRKL